MTLAVKLLGQGGSDTDATSYATTGLTAPTPGSLILACIRVLDLTSQTQAPTVTGLGLTWNGGGASDNAMATPRMQASTAYANQDLLTSGEITWSSVVSAATADGAQWMVVEVTDQANGAGAVFDAILDAQGNQANVDNTSITLSTSVGITGSTLQCAFCGAYDASGGAMAFTPGTGYGIIDKDSVSMSRIDTIGGDTLRMAFEYATRAAATDTVVDFSVAVANDRVQMRGWGIAEAPTIPRPVRVHDQAVHRASRW